MMYKMQIQAMVSGLPWEYNFDMASDDMAMSVATKWLQVPGNVPANCMSVLLWRMADEKLLVELAVEQFVQVRALASRATARG